MSVQQQINEFVEDLKATHGSNLLSVVLYGSAATGEFEPAVSDINLLVALQRITPKDLRDAQPPLREWKKLGYTSPHYFTVGELQGAADVFPIEFHGMERARRVLYGIDPLEKVEISDTFLRHQAEYELRVKLLQLRRAYIPNSTDKKRLERLMRESLPSFATLFRAVLLLLGKETSVRKHEVIDYVVRELDLDPRPFEAIFALREKENSTLSEQAAHEVFAQYLEQIERVVAVVDSIGKPKAT